MFKGVYVDIKKLKSLWKLCCFDLVHLDLKKFN